MLINLRFENHTNKNQGLLCDPTKLRFENHTNKKNAQASLAFFRSGGFIRDPNIQ